MNVTHITTHSIREAWSKADEIFPTDYMHDSDRTRRAGYDIYFSTRPGCAAWISDLGNRLEVNMENGDTVEIWIEDDDETTETETTEEARETEETTGDSTEIVSAEQAAEWTAATKIAESMTIEALFVPEVCQRATICIDGDYGSDGEKAIYQAIKSGHPSILFDLLTRYAETHGIKWGGIWGCEARHYDHGKTGRGHYIVSGYISGRIGEEIDFCANCADILRQAAENHKNR